MLIRYFVVVMIGFQFTPFKAGENKKSMFEQMLDLFTELLNYTNGDATEALDWLNQLDRKHKFTNNDYGMGDFIEDLKENGYLKENGPDGTFKITSKTEQTIRKKSLEDILGSLKKAVKAITKPIKRDPAQNLVLTPGPINLVTILTRLILQKAFAMHKSIME